MRSHPKEEVKIFQLLSRFSSKMLSSTSTQIPLRFGNHQKVAFILYSKVQLAQRGREDSLSNISIETLSSSRPSTSHLFHDVFLDYQEQNCSLSPPSSSILWVTHQTLIILYLICHYLCTRLNSSSQRPPNPLRDLRCIKLEVSYLMCLVVWFLLGTSEQSISS